LPERAAPGREEIALLCIFKVDRDIAAAFREVPAGEDRDILIAAVAILAEAGLTTELNPSKSCFSLKLTAPAIASEPYTAEP
jgi:hypothetical protein